MLKHPNPIIKNLISTFVTALIATLLIIFVPFKEGTENAFTINNALWSIIVIAGLGYYGFMTVMSSVMSSEPSYNSAKYKNHFYFAAGVGAAAFFIQCALTMQKPLLFLLVAGIVLHLLFTLTKQLKPFEEAITSLPQSE